MKNNRALLITIVTIVALFIGAVVLLPQIKKSTSDGSDDGDTDTTTTTEVDISKYNITKPIAANSDNGGIADHVKGNIETAKVVIYEYADYACSHCAEANIVINKLIKDYDGKVAVVFRGYLINYFRNNVIAASAATAAQLQGYWNEYKNLLFENQATWYYQSGSKLRDYLGELFTEASDGNGDLAKFYEDLDSKEVAKRVAFEYGLGAKVDIAGTPTFRINGEPVAVSSIRETVEDLVKKLNN